MYRPDDGFFFTFFREQYANEAAEPFLKIVALLFSQYPFPKVNPLPFRFYTGIF